MQEKEIIKYLKDNIEPIQDNVYGIGYRASIYLLDGTFIPCVVFRNSKKIVDLAIRRFHEEQKVKGIFNKSGYRDIVKSFVTKNNCVVSHDIQRIEKSRFAIPYSIMKQIYGETYMSWTGFLLNEKRKCFNFGQHLI